MDGGDEFPQGLKHGSVRAFAARLKSCPARFLSFFDEHRIPAAKAELNFIDLRYA
jgi:hypothetical protein